MLNPSSPLKCTSPSDVYLYLKSSDFIGHDLDPEMVFDGCLDAGDTEEARYELELVLKKWYPIDRSREMRCFVRDDTLIGELSVFHSAGWADGDRRNVPRNMPAGYEFLRPSNEGRHAIPHTRGTLHIFQG